MLSLCPFAKSMRDFFSSLLSAWHISDRFIFMNDVVSVFQRDILETFSIFTYFRKKNHFIVTQ